MALINCPNCGKQVSDKSEKCIYCGEKLIKDDKKHCIDCGAELDENITVCPNCGCPVEDENKQKNIERPQQVEVTGVKVAKKTKSKIGVAIIISIIAIVIVIGATKYKNKKISETYADNLQLVILTMYTGASEAESGGNLIKQVWYNSIYEESDSKTDKYTRPKGYFVSDFNDALDNLFSDPNFSEKINSIEENNDAVNELMKKLKNPPDEYKDAYEALSDLYDAYIELTNCTTNPTGSLNTYSSYFNYADTEVAKCFNAMDIYLDD